MFPAAQMLGAGADLAGQFKPSKTKISPNAYGTYGSGARNSYGVGTYNPKSGAGGF